MQGEAGAAAEDALPKAVQGAHLCQAHVEGAHLALLLSRHAVLQLLGLLLAVHPAPVMYTWHTTLHSLDSHRHHFHW